jgi:hypothetical protein
MWIDDDELIERLTRLSAASVVISKQGRGKRDRAKLEALQHLNEQTPGLPAEAFPGLGGLAPTVQGRPAVLGPFDDPLKDLRMSTVRTLGYRKVDDRLVPIIHAKLALLGELWWHDEGALGHVEEVIGFRPHRLWVSSANFTRNSRKSLDFGVLDEGRGAPRRCRAVLGFSHC